MHDSAKEKSLVEAVVFISTTGHMVVTGILYF